MKRKALQKLIALTVVFVLMFCLGACGSKDSDPASATKATSEDESESGNESTGTEANVKSKCEKNIKNFKRPPK